MASNPEITERLCRFLTEFLGPELVRCYKDTIDYTRFDTASMMRAAHREAARAFYTGSIWVDETKGEIGFGDVVVPTQKEEEMKRKVEEFGCKISYVHVHPEYGTSHIHVEKCPVRAKEYRFAEIVTG